MKKLLAITTAAIALAAAAKPEKAITVKIADAKTLTAAATKICEISEIGMMGMQAADSIQNNQFTKILGPARDGVPGMFVVYVDGEAAGASVADIDSRTKVAFLYPTALAKTDFIAKHGAKEENGAIEVKDGVVVFSEDGKWLSYSDKADSARLALADTTLAEKPMEGKLVKAAVKKPAMEIYRALLEKGIKDTFNAADKIAKSLEYLNLVAEARLSVAVSDKGIDFAGTITPVKGSLLEKVGDVALEGNPFVFAGADVVCVSISSKGGALTDGVAALKNQIEAFAKILTDNGLCSKWIETSAFPDSIKVTLDVDSFVKCAAANSDKIAALDGEKIAAEMAECASANAAASALAVTDKPQGVAIAIKNSGFVTPICKRFAKVYPKAFDKKPYSVGYVTLYGTVRVLLDRIIASTPADSDAAQTLAMVKPIVETLPAAEQGGVGLMAWKNPDGKHQAAVRISAAELKSIGKTINAAMGYIMMSAMNSCPCGTPGAESVNEDGAACPISSEE